MAVPRSDAPRRSRVLSFTSTSKSEKSHKTGASSAKNVPHPNPNPTSADAEHRRMHSKADPTLAISEAQPAVIALEKSNLESLRMVQHKDVYGNPIVDPDISNPTRHRLERPLDTIRSFEAAIDGSYNNRRTSYIRQDESPNGYSRRSSYFGDSRPVTNYNNRAFNENHHYNARGNQSRPDSYAEPYASSYVTPYGNPHGQQPRPNRHNQRMNGDAPYVNPTQNVYPQQSAHQSYDNVTAGSGSGSNRTDQWGNSTDPSSVNSSLDRLQQQQQQQQQNLEKTYGFSGFGNGPQLDYNQQGYGQPTPPAPVANGYGQQQYAQSSMPPPVPRKQMPQQLQKAPSQTPTSEKKKSWFKKRFSKG
ncbi:hypothetical protein FQN54_003513 [Arachnomyces sp. PD_36]|nr:hypothetical protein FQN54_003513 [Arachnomyces sp. PD_36]